MRRALLLALVLAAGTACAEGGSAPERILLVTTTTVEDSGLLDALIAAFDSAQDRYRLATTAVGSGAALEIGRRGDATVLVTHDPVGEKAFLDAGYALEQGPVMRNEFLIAGPASDPAGVAGAAGPVAALRRIARAGAPFVSRGDESGTHRKERALWAEAGLEPWTDRPSWYIESGAGMGETLQLASERGAYVLTDRSTFLNLGRVIRLVALIQNDDRLVNRYTYSLPSRSPDTAAARAFIDWITGAGQDVIARYGVARFGEPLFRPTADPDSVRHPGD